MFEKRKKLYREIEYLQDKVSRLSDKISAANGAYGSMREQFLALTAYLNVDVQRIPPSTSLPWRIVPRDSAVVKKSSGCAAPPVEELPWGPLA